MARTFPQATAHELKKQARDNGMLTPSIAGIWKHGENIFGGDVTERAIANANRTASVLEAGMILVVMFKENCPDMSEPTSYGPVVESYLGGCAASGRREHEALR